MHLVRGFEFPGEPDFGELPVPSHRPGGGLEDLGRFLLAEAAEVAEFHHLGLAGSDAGELFQGFVECEQQAVGSRSGDLGLVETHYRDCASALERAAFSGGINEDPSNQLGNEGEELSAMLPVDASKLEEAQIDFVDEGGGLQAVRRMLVAEVAMRNPAQLRQEQLR